MSKNLYSFYWDCGRSGSLDGLFITDPETLEKYIGKDVYFGEVLGKHSEIYGSLDKKDVKLVSDDTEKVLWLYELMGDTVSGFNPIEYISEEEEEFEDE
jgi:hypothetical protein